MDTFWHYAIYVFSTAIDVESSLLAGLKFSAASHGRFGSRE